MALVALIASAAGCRDLDVVTEAYATLTEATTAGAVDRGWLPRGLPQGTIEIRIAHDLDSSRRWGLFNFPQDQADALRATLGAEISVDGQSCNPPRRIEWWPLLLRDRLMQERLTATGLRTYTARDTDLTFAVNWKQGRAYYWTKE